MTSQSQFKLILGQTSDLLTTQTDATAQISVLKSDS